MSVINPSKTIQIGDVFCRLTVLRFERDKHRRRAYLCQCVCGKETSATPYTLYTGKKISCGCSSGLTKIVHGHSSSGGFRKPSKTYTTWRSMIARCTLTSYAGHHRYGGRGINVCDRWTCENGFLNFLEDMGEKPKGLSLDRRDNNAGYSPMNCRWATAKEQAANRSNTIVLECDGRKQTLAEWASEKGMQHGTLTARLRQGWSAARAITEPVQRRRLG